MEEKGKVVISSIVVLTTIKVDLLDNREINLVCTIRGR